MDPEPTPGEPNRVSMQDLIDAGLDQETIQLILALLSEKGETLLDEVPTEEIVEELASSDVIEGGPIEATEESQSETPEAILPEESIITEESQEVNSEEVMEEVIEESVLPHQKWQVQGSSPLPPVSQY